MSGHDPKVFTIKFSAYATNFETHPKTGDAYKRLLPLLSQLARVNFSLRVANAKANQGQMVSNLDQKLKMALEKLGAKPFKLRLPAGIHQEFDFAFKFADQSVAVEIEKTNREKILRDILKCHTYLHVGAHFAVVGLPKNYPHKHGVWNLFDFGVHRFNECRTYGFGTRGKFGRILLLGFEQFDAKTDELLSQKTRQRMRQKASKEAKKRSPTSIAKKTMRSMRDSGQD